MKLPMRSRRSVAAGLAGTLVAGAFAALSVAPAQADVSPAAGALTWNVSAQFISGFSERSTGGGASYDAETGQFVWPASDASRKADGTVVVEHRGTITGGAPVGRGGYSVTFADPVVELAADGSGEIRATVSSQNPALGGRPADSTEPTTVTVAEFASSTGADGLVTAVPNWVGVLATDSAEAAALGAKTGEPVDGKAFHPEFLGAITEGIRPWFWRSATATNDNRAPGQLSFDATVTPSISYQVTSATKARGLEIAVQGRNFTKTNEAGQKGVYIILAPADLVIDFDDPEFVNDPRIAGAAYAYDGIRSTHVMGEDGSFDLDLPIEQEKVKAGTDYVLVTWSAHYPHLNPSQSTTTPVAIDWSSWEPKPAKKASKVVLKVNKQATTKKAGKATVTVKGNPKATGRVVVKIKRAGVKKVRTVKVKLNKKGKASFKLVKAKKKGQYKVTVKYNGDKSWKASKQVAKKYRVKK